MESLGRAKGWLGSGLWRAAHFRSQDDLIDLAAQAGLRDAAVTGAVFYPPLGIAARLMAPVDHEFGNVTTIGGAFLVLTATSSAEGSNKHESDCEGARQRSGSNKALDMNERIT